MLQNAYLLAKIGADTAENEQHFAEILPKISVSDGRGEPDRRQVRDPKVALDAHDVSYLDAHHKLLTKTCKTGLSLAHMPPDGVKMYFSLPSDICSQLRGGIMQPKLVSSNRTVRFHEDCTVHCI